MAVCDFEGLVCATQKQYMQNISHGCSAKRRQIQERDTIQGFTFLHRALSLMVLLLLTENGKDEA